MFAKYKNLIQTLFDNVFCGGDTPITFLQYLQVIGMSLLLLLIVAVFIGFIVSIFVLPKKFITWLTKNLSANLAKELNPESGTIDFQKAFALEHKLKIRKIIGVIIIIFIYVPIGLPTLLYIMDMLTRAI